MEKRMPNRRNSPLSVQAEWTLKMAISLLAGLTFVWLVIDFSYNNNDNWLLSRPRSTQNGVKSTQLLPLLVATPSSGPHRRFGRECYTAAHIDPLRIVLLDDVLTANTKRPARTARNIFFHETTCSQDGRLHLNVRQACAIESAARVNPDADVYLLFTSPVGVERGQRQPAVFDALGRYANIHWRNLDLWSYTLDTPAAGWMDSDALFASRYLAEHTADMLRLMSLFKWGGTHIDLDFVVRRTFGTAQNFAAEEDVGEVANGLLNFAADGIGHRIVGRALGEFVRDFRGDQWAVNGPLLVSRVLREMCDTDNLLECRVFRVHQKELFYAVSWRQWRLLFEPTYGARVAALVNRSVAVHFWNKMSAGTAVRLGEGSAYELMAKQFCPEVVKSIVGGKF